MIDLYYQKHQEWLNDTTQRIEKCPMMKTKTFCSQCSIHCYEKKIQEKIKSVMKYG